LIFLESLVLGRSAAGGRADRLRLAGGMSQAFALNLSGIYMMRSTCDSPSRRASTALGVGLGLGRP